MIVVDSSVLVHALLDDRMRGRASWARLRTGRLCAPCLVDLEVVSALRRQLALGALEEHRVGLALRSLAALRLRRVPPKRALTMLGRKLFPPAAYVRYGWPIARRGPWHLAGTYVVRLLLIPLRLAELVPFVRSGRPSRFRR